MSITINDLYEQKLEIDALNLQSVECHERLKITRGYYATFLYARELLKSDNKIKAYHPPNRCGSHQKIALKLSNSGIRVLSEVGEKLASYHFLRKKADYHIHLKITEDDIRNAEDYMKYCQERISFYKKYGNKPFTTAEKVIDVTKNSSGIKFNNHRGLKVLK